MTNSNAEFTIHLFVDYQIAEPFLFLAKTLKDTTAQAMF